MKTKLILLACVFALAADGLPDSPARSNGPIIPPTISKVWPVGMERGKTVIFTIEGRSLDGAQKVLFDAPGLEAKVQSVIQEQEEIQGPRAGLDTEAAVPLGKKTEARIEVVASADAKPGLHWFRIETPLGTSNTGVIEVTALPEVPHEKPAEGNVRWVQFPATLVGTLSSPGEIHRFGFEGKKGQELVFSVVAATLGSKLKSELVLQDSQGKVLAKAGEFSREADVVLAHKFQADGKYTIELLDREHGGGKGYFYRVNAGELALVTSVFPLGVQAGKPTEVAVQGVNLKGVDKVKVDPPKWADGWTVIPLRFENAQIVPINKVELVVGNENEVLEKEPNNTPQEAQPIHAPVTINGHIAGANGAADEDYFRFSARQGEKLTIEVAAARLGSPLDSVIEVLDSRGKPVPRATVRCLYQTSATLSDRDSRTQAIRFLSLTGFRENDYVMIGDELDQISTIPDQPDADVIMKGVDGQRLTFLGTSPALRPVDTPIYKAQILPPDAKFAPNGLPVFHITYRNDDGGPGFGADSRLDFTAPKEGEFLVHLKDVRGVQGSDFAYRLTIRQPNPDFMLTAQPDSPNIPRGGDVPVTVVANRGQGYEGPIQIEVKGLPKGVTASPAKIPEGQDSTVVVLASTPDAPLGEISSLRILGRAVVSGREIVRVANQEAPLQVASIIPAPDLLVRVSPSEVTLEPGKEVKLQLHVQRNNTFKGRVPCRVVNLPPGVRVVNVGLNGVLVHEGEENQTFTLRAEDWAAPIEQPIYVVGEVESNSPTLHASRALTLKVERPQLTRLRN
jgi:hypothetical protein